MKGEAEKGKRKKPEGSSPSVPSDEEKDRERKMERFFALLESIREMRKRSSAGSGEPRKKGKAEGSVWTPTFEWEDFAGAAASRNRKNLNPSAGICQGTEEKDDEGPCLDLRLTL